MMKPKTAFREAASSDAPKVRRYDASARGSVAMLQNSASGRLPALSTSAAIGISTIVARKAPEIPSVRPNPGNTLGCTHLLDCIDRIEYSAIVEVLRLRLFPAAEYRVDREQVDVWIVILIAPRDFRVARPEMVTRD